MNKIQIVKDDEVIDAEIIEGEIIEDDEDDEYLFGCKSSTEEASFITGLLDAMFRNE